MACTVLQDVKVESMQSFEQPVLLEEQATHSETPTPAWPAPEQKRDIGEGFPCYAVVACLFVCFFAYLITENLTYGSDHDNNGGSYGEHTLFRLVNTYCCGFVDLLKEVLMHQEQPSSPKRPRSPLKKCNKVAPLNITDKNSALESKPSLDSPLLTTAKPIVMDTNVTLDNDDDSMAHVIANPNVDSNSILQIKPFTS